MLAIPERIKEDTATESGYVFDPKSISIYQTVVSPQVAQEWLVGITLEVGQAYEAMVEHYARQMAVPNWRMNGDPIIFDDRGRLINGQARLRACILSGMSFTTLVVDRVPSVANLTVGSHLQRTVKDMLTINGEVYGPELAAAWPIVIGYLQRKDAATFTVTRRHKLGVEEVEALTEGYPEMRDSAELMRGLGAVKRYGAGLMTATHYLMSLADAERAGRFMRILIDPSLAPDSAPATLATRLGMETRTGQTYRLAIFLKAWNAFRQDQPISVDRLRFEGKERRGTPEPFPRLDGLPADAKVELHDLDYHSVTPVSAEAVYEGSRRVTATIELVTPKVAADLMTRNGPIGGTGNRNLRSNHVTSLRRDLESQAWVFNGQPIKIAVSGRMIDGQHRCQACIDSGIPFWTLVVRGLDDDVFSTYDTGQRKGLSIALREAGYDNPTTIAASVSLISKVMGKGWRTLTNNEGFEMLREHPGVPASVASVQSNKAASFMPKAFLATIDYLAGRVDRAETNVFMGKLSEGNNLDTGTPLLVFRELMVQQKNSPERPVTERILRWGMITWNAHRKGVNPFKLRDGGKYPPLV